MDAFGEHLTRARIEQIIEKLSDEIYNFLLMNKMILFLNYIII
jgi:hypothetical protein